jgi:hypothetical protein
VKRSGTAGAPVVVWSPRTGPARAWLRDEAAVLRSIGYAARVRAVPDATYRNEISALIPRPAAGHTSRSSGVRPVPARHTVKTSGRQALMPVSAVIGGRLGGEIRVPVSDALTIALSPDVTLNRARRDHQAAFAEQAVPALMSWRMNEADAVVDPVEGLDLTSLRLR